MGDSHDKTRNSDLTGRRIEDRGAIMTAKETHTTNPRDELAAFFDGDQDAISGLSPITYVLQILSRRIFRRYPSIDVDFTSSSILLGLLMYTSMAVVNVLTTGHRAIILWPQIQLTVVGVLCIMISIRERRRGFSELSRNLSELMIESNEISAVLVWLRSVFRLRLQAAFQLATSIIVLGTTMTLIDSPELGYRLSMSFSFSLVWLVASNLLYGGMIYPRLWNQMSRCKISLHWMRPDLTPGLREIASTATRLSMRSTLVAALAVVGINAFIGPIVQRYDVLLILSSAVMLVAIATFVGPHRQLRRIVIRGKYQSIDDIEQLILRLRLSNSTLDSSTLEAIEKLANLQRLIADGPNSMITLGSLTSLVASLAIPVLTYASDVITKWIVEYLAS